MSHLRHSPLYRLVCGALVGAGVSLGCAQLLGLERDVPSGPCTVQSDCAPGEVCALGTCRASGATGGTAGSGAAGGSDVTAGGGNGSGGNGSGGEADGDGCGGTPVDGAAACSELPDGTPVTFPGGSPQGSCALGTKVCTSDGTFGPCEGTVPPGQTDCSTSSDINCDGTPDDSQCGVCSLGDTQYCYDGPPDTLGVGTCMQGTQVCELDASGQAEVWGPCAGQVTPAPGDTCEPGNDATCNAVPNEGCLCIDGESSDCGSELQSLGNCAAGTTQCVNGAWSNCSIAAKAADTCDLGDDATCNGQANEGCICINSDTRECGISGTGCSLGTQTCQSGAWGSCVDNTCVDFSVTAPTAKCSASGPNGEIVENSCSIAVCSAGYYVTDCNLFVSSGSGTCSFDGATFGNTVNASVTATKALTATSVGCSFNTCTCRRNGF